MRQPARIVSTVRLPAMVAMGIHPLVAFLANMQVQREGRPPTASG